MKLLIMTKHYILITSFIGLIACFNQAYAGDGVRVIAHADQELPMLSKQEIVNLFMGGASQFNLSPLELPPGNEHRAIFNTMVVGLTEARIQSYWAQMRFSGRMRPPMMLDDESDVLAYVRQNSGTIAYVSSAAELPENVQVIFEIHLSN
ncbi:hypothetical protein PN836_020610 [Ningiella sp. W23]|uniref:hypothetical protein n=1 Tax=Ningiella sp. W23 TaxID=3023715 RepID=UPI003757FF1D